MNSFVSTVTVGGVGLAANTCFSFSERISYPDFPWMGGWMEADGEFS